ncbi:hypothetical protein L1887_49564 [Cichorium endivia]|nr:hypothetical protein L1887_49564 [Cichorium endivia]
MFFASMAISTISINGSGLQIQTSSAEAAQASNATTTGKQRNNQLLNKMDYKMDATGKTVVSKAGNTIANWGSIVLIAVAGIVGLIFLVKGGIDLKRTADEGKKPTWADVGTSFIIGAFCINFILFNALFMPNADNCTYEGFVTGECGNYSMTATGALEEKIKKVTANANTVYGDFLDTVLALSKVVKFIGFFYVFKNLMWLKRMNNGQDKTEYGAFMTAMMFSVLVVNHKFILDGLILFARSAGANI